uniref:Mic1 domain-containing protein n=1 Tax=Amphiprion ocellaris TaxID=80972 RepID=A0AAQ5ZK87_AMPOC
LTSNICRLVISLLGLVTKIPRLAISVSRLFTKSLLMSVFTCSPGYLWYLQVKLHPTVNLLQDKGKLMDFLLRRRDCKMVILSVCSQILEGGVKGSLPVVATVFDKLNQVYKEYLEAEQSYTVAMESGPSRGSAAQKRPVRTQAVIDQSDMYTHVLSSFTERKEVSHKFVIAVLMEYIRSLNQHQITVQHYLYELVIKTLVQHNLFYMLHQFLQYHVLSDSKPLACLLLSLESTYPPAHQLSLDMLKRLSTANDEIVEVLLSKQQVLGALRFIRSVGGHDNVSARKFLDAARQTGDQMLFYTVFRSFQQRNQRLRGSPAFNPGEHCEEHVVHFKQLFGEQALMKPSTV